MLAQPAALTRGAVALLLLWLLVGPRIELPGLHGARVEDVVLAVLAVICALHVRALGRPSAVTLAVLGVAGAGLVSAGVANARGTVDPLASVLYAVRPLETWIAFPAALLLVSGANVRWTRVVDALLVAVTVLQTGFAVLQYYFGVPVGFSHAAYTRAAGLTVGPYELGAIGAALVVYWVARGRWVLASVALVGLASSISRVSLLGAALAVGVLATVWAVQQRARVRQVGWRAAFRPVDTSPLRMALQAGSVAVSALVLAFTLGIVHLPVAPPAAPVASAPVVVDDGGDVPDDDGVVVPEAPVAPPAPAQSLAQRFESTSVLGSWIRSGEIAKAVPPLRTSAEYADIAYARYNWYVSPQTTDAAGAEASNLVRFFRWHVILNTVDDPGEVLVGLGPSFVGPSVDGSYLRFFAEGGLLGLLAWGALIVVWLRRSPLWMRCVTLSLLVGALFIDIVYAQRPMVLFWMLLALAVAGASDAAQRTSTPADARTATEPQAAGA